METIKIPTTWSDVTVDEYQQLASLDTNQNQSKRLRDILSIVTNVNPNDIDKGSLVELQNHLGFMNEEIPTERYDSVMLDGKLYEWRKSLNAITLGEQISIEQIMETEELSFADSFDLIMAVLLIEEGTEFDSNKIEENRLKFLKLPITDVYGMILFFLSGGRMSSDNTKVYLVQPKAKKTMIVGQMKKDKLMKRLQKRAVTMVLNGLQWLTVWLKTILQNMT